MMGGGEGARRVKAMTGASETGPSSVIFAAAIVGACVAFANTAAACAPAYAALDDALWKDAKESGIPARWVQYFVSQGCDANKQAALALLKPLFGDSTGSGSAVSQVVMSGKFGGDTWEAAVNAQPLKSAARRVGAYLDGFHMRSKLVVHDCVSHYQSRDYCIPAVLYPDGKLPGENAPEKDVALWVQYRCGLPTREETGWLDDLTASNQWGTDCPAADGVAYDRIGFQLAGPYRNFFNLSASCEKNGGDDCERLTGEIRSVTLTLSPAPAYGSFLQLLTGGHVR